MDKSNIEKLNHECKKVEEDSTFTAEVLHIMAGRLERKYFWYKFVPVLMTVIGASRLVYITDVPNSNEQWVAWCTLISGIITIINILLEPEKKSRDCLMAAKQLVTLKHEARSLHESFSSFLSESEFCLEVKNLRSKYNLLVQFIPKSDDKKAVKEAQENINKGIHKSDIVD